MWIGGARAVVLDDSNNMLLLRQCHEGRDIWMAPGGGIEDGENAAEAAIREVREETGLEISVGSLLWHVEEVSERGQRFVNFYIGRITGGTLALGEDPEFDEAGQVLREVRFMPRSEVEKIENLYPEYLRYEFWDMLEEIDFKNDAFKVR